MNVIQALTSKLLRMNPLETYSQAAYPPYIDGPGACYMYIPWREVSGSSLCGPNNSVWQLPRWEPRYRPIKSVKQHVPYPSTTTPIIPYPTIEACTATYPTSVQVVRDLGYITPEHLPCSRLLFGCVHRQSLQV